MNIEVHDIKKITISPIKRLWKNDMFGNYRSIYITEDTGVVTEIAIFSKDAKKLIIKKENE